MLKSCETCVFGPSVDGAIDSLIDRQQAVRDSSDELIISTGLRAVDVAECDAQYDSEERGCPKVLNLVPIIRALEAADK